jgi:nitrogenase subunit NifH
MAQSRKKYFLNIIFLVSPITLSLYAQSSIEKPTTSIATVCSMTASNNQNNDTSDSKIISELENSNQFIAGLSIPKDSLPITTDSNAQTTSKCEDNSSLAASYSLLAKDIIENYRYDFSETFIDILFFENIDLARKRTI